MDAIRVIDLFWMNVNRRVWKNSMLRGSVIISEILLSINSAGILVENKVVKKKNSAI